MAPTQERQELWDRLVKQVATEYRQLDDKERNWIRQACEQISHLQQQLDALFCRADGLRQCRDCRGDCCALGHNHLTLANLLIFLDAEIEPPSLDFGATCPLLGPAGCAVPAAQRPYNCISFLCDRIEDQLDPAGVAEFYRLERALRDCYRAFAARYTGGSMSGLLLAARRLDGRPFLQRLKTGKTTRTGDR